MEMILILGFGALLIFFMMNSRKKQRQQQEKLSSGLVIGAQVMTTFGVYGIVIDVQEEENKVTIESGPGTVLTVHRQAIGTIDDPIGAADDGLDGDSNGIDSGRLDDDLRNTEIPDDLSSLTPSEQDDEVVTTTSTGTSGSLDDMDADLTDDVASDADDRVSETDTSAASDATASDATDSDAPDSDPTDSDSSETNRSDDDRR